MTGDSMSAVLGAAATYVDAAADGAARALTVVVGSVAGRRFFRREVLPLWKDRWADLSVTYSVADAADAPPPPPLQREWPSAAARALLETPSATLAALEPPPAADDAAAAVIVVVAGLPGSGAADAADALAAATRDRARWLTTGVDQREWIGDDGACDSDALGAALRAALDGGGAAADGLPARLLVSYEGHSPLVSALAALHRAAAALPLRVGAAVCVVDAARAAEAGGRCAAGTLEQLTAGFCQAVVLSRADAAPPAAVAALASLIGAANPTADVIRAAGARAPPPRSSRRSSPSAAANRSPSTLRRSAAPAPPPRPAGAPRRRRRPTAPSPACVPSSSPRRRSPSPSCSK